MTSLHRSTRIPRTRALSKHKNVSHLQRTWVLLELLEPRVLLSVVHPVFAARPKPYNILVHQDGVSPDATTIVGLTPTTVRKAYGMNQVMFGNVAGDGAGQTIAIVDAYRAPNIVLDIRTFSTAFGLPNANLTVINQLGGTNPAPLDPAGLGGWSVETSLDVEWVHAMAPGAKIVLVSTNSNSNPDLMAGVLTAAAYPGVCAVSMSFGRPEVSSDLANDSIFTTPIDHIGITFIASSGDQGAYTPGTTVKSVSWPASVPNVLAVGGTRLSVDGQGNYVSETAWGSGTGSSTAGGAGGGVSKFEDQPAYQRGIVTQSSTKRTVPDVAFVADPVSGVAIYDSYDFPGSPWQIEGGTSLSAPMWAGVMAVVNQGRTLYGLGTFDGATETLPKLYALPRGDFHDVITGNNGFAAGPGYDLITGLGTPIVNRLIPDLVGVGPSIESLTVDPPSLAAGQTITLTAANVVANSSGSTVTSVKFYRESNGTAGLQIGSDSLIGSGVQSSNSWTLVASTAGFGGGDNTLYAVASDSSALSSVPATAILSVVTPVIGSFTVSPNSLSTSLLTTFTASNVTEDLGGVVGDVSFYRESNHIAGFQNTDTLLGHGTLSGSDWTLNLNTTGIAPGAYTVYAVATDTGNVSSPASSAALTILPPPPANDNFASATVINGVSATLNGSNAFGSRETSEPLIAQNPGGRSVWYTWTAPADGKVTIATRGSTFNTLLAVYTGSSVSALSLVAANNDAAIRVLTSSVTFNAISGQTYQITVDGFNGAAGNIFLSLNEVVPPANDNFANATALVGNNPVFSGSSLGATREAGEPLITGLTGGSSVWLTWTPTTSGVVTMTTSGSNFDTLLGVYTGSAVNALTQVAANNNISSLNWTSSVSFNAVAGTTYYIAIDGKGGAAGNILLSIL